MPTSSVTSSKGHRFAIDLLAGFLIGAANTLPGLSGGSVALILGVYERLISSLDCLRLNNIIALKDPMKRQVFIDKLDPWFLGLVFIGLLLGVFSFSFFVPFFVDNYPKQVNALFLGLLAASIPHTFSLIKSRPSPTHVLIAIAFAIAAMWLSTLHIEFHIEGWAFQFVCGALAIFAMLLPGISGGFVLVLMGNYRFIIGEINQLSRFNIDALLNLLPFICGAGFGLIFFVRAVNFFLKYFRNATLCALLGLLIGSLKMLWPFAGIAASVSEMIPIIFIAMAGFFITWLMHMGFRQR